MPSEAAGWGGGAGDHGGFSRVGRSGGVGWRTWGIECQVGDDFTARLARGGDVLQLLDVAQADGVVVIYALEDRLVEFVQSFHLCQQRHGVCLACVGLGAAELFQNGAELLKLLAGSGRRGGGMAGQSP